MSSETERFLSAATIADEVFGSKGGLEENFMAYLPAVIHRISREQEHVNYEAAAIHNALVAGLTLAAKQPNVAGHLLEMLAPFEHKDAEPIVEAIVEMYEELFEAAT